MDDVRVERIEETLAGLTAAVDGLGVRLGARIDAVETRLDAKIDAGFAQVQAAFEDSRKYAEFLVERSEKTTKEGFAQVDRRFERIDGQLGQMNRRLERVDERLERIENGFGDMNRRFDRLEERLFPSE